MKQFLRFALLLALVSVTSLSYGQSTIDFETVGNGWTWSTFENNNIVDAFKMVANPDVSGINTTSNCGKMVIDAAGAPYAGVECKHGDFGPYLWSSSNYVVKFMVYKSVISPIGLKFATSAGWAKAELKVSNTKINQWEEITIDFSAYAGDAQPEPFDQIIIFPDFPASRSAGSISYIDNISFPGATPETISVSTSSLSIAAAANSTKTFGITSALSWTISSDQTWLTPNPASGTGNATITLTASANSQSAARTANVTVTAGDATNKTILVTQAGTAVSDAPTPTVDASKVKSIFSDAYTPVESTYQNWYATNMTEVSSVTPTNKVKNVSSDCCFGYLFATPMNMSSLTTLHVDIYPTTVASMNIGIVSSGDHKKLIALTANTWNSIDIELLDIASAGNLASVPQVGFWDIKGAFYMDNLYLYNKSTVDDTEAPTAFTASAGALTSESVELLLNATDNSGAVNYTVSYGTGPTVVSTSGVSGVTKSFVVSGLTPTTDYSFSITAKDAAGNAASNNPIVVNATTSLNTGECSGTSTVNTDGTSFTDGYKYQFVTSGINVHLSFECLDPKVGLVAYLFNRTGGGFSETMMTNSYGQVFEITLAGQSPGSKITVACKFAFAGGLSVTKDFTYTVGNDCGIIIPEGLKLPIDFEAATYDFVDFSGGTATVIANPHSSGLNTSANVAQMVRNVGDVWAGSKLVLGSKLDLSTKSGFSMKVYSARAGVPVTLKLELSTNGGVNAEVSAVTTVANEWETLTWDFTGKSSNTYDALTFLFDLNSVGDGSANSTFLFDDIEQIDVSGGLTQVDLPVTFESSTVNYKLIDFGGNASVLGADPENAANTVAITTKGAASETWAGTTIGTDLGFKTVIPFTALLTKISVKVYSPAAGIPVRLKVEDHANNGITAETEAITTLANAWETLIFDFSNVAAGTNPFNLSSKFDKMSIFFNFGTPGAGEIYYFDDVTFIVTTGVRKADGSSLDIYPNPSGNSLFVKGPSKDAKIIILDMNGKVVMSKLFDNNPLYTGNLAKGIYTIHVVEKSGTTSKKFVKE